MYIDLIELKKRIYEDENIIPILENLNCLYIHYEQGDNLICAGLPEGFGSDNKRTIQIKNNENLTAHVRSRGVTGNIFSVVGFILYDCETFEDVRENLYHIIQWICNTLDYDIYSFDTQPKEKKTDWLYFLRDVQKERNREFELDSIPINNPISKNVMLEYLPLLHIDWFNTGINHDTRELFDIRFDLKTERIVFPVHDKYGNIIGVKGRSIDDEHDSKYMYLYPCQKSIELFNLHRALEYILKEKRVYIFEGAKSTFLSSQWNYRNCCSIEGDMLSPVQIRLLKELGIDIELCFVYDSDKNEEFVRNSVSQIKNRKVKIFIDKDNLLDPRKKLSPVDLGKDIFEQIISNYLFTTTY